MKALQLYMTNQVIANEVKIEQLSFLQTVGVQETCIHEWFIYLKTRHKKSNPVMGNIP